MSRPAGLTALALTMLCVGCAKQTPAPPPTSPALGAPSANPGSQNSVDATSNQASDPQLPTRSLLDAEKLGSPTASTETTAGEKTTAKTPETKTAQGTAAVPSPRKTTGASQVQADLNLVTDDVVAALVAHPKRALESPLLKGLKQEGVVSDEELDQALQPFMTQTGLDPRNIEEVVILINQPLVNQTARNMGLPINADAGAPAVAKPAVVYINNLKQVGLGFHNYLNTFNFFPSDGGSGDGEHRLGFSWRVQLAPYVEAAAVYNAINFDEDWDSDVNEPLHEQMPAAFGTQGVTDPGLTSMHVLSGEGTLFNGDQGARLAQITDGTSNTILAVSAGADTADIWMKPGGLEFDPASPLDCLGTIEADFPVLMADGSVQRMPKNIDPEVFSKLVTCNDGQAVDFQRSVQQSSLAAAPFGLLGMQPDSALVIVFKMAAPIDQKKFLAQLPGEAEPKGQGQRQYFAAEGWAMAFPTPDTAIFSGEERVKRALESAGAPSKSAVADQLRAAGQPFDVLLAVDFKSQEKLMQSLVQMNPLLGPAANLESLRIAASNSGQPGDSLFSIEGTARSPETAQTLAAMVNGVALTQLKTALAMQAQAPVLTEEQKTILGIVEPGLQALEMTTDGNAFDLQWPIPDGFDELPKLLAPALRQAKDAQADMRKLNNLKQIALAFHNYHDVYGRFPKAGGPAMENPSVTDGLSWRVHLLPFLDQAPLYTQFHLDEPWDSEHNQTLIEQMPDIFKTDGVNEPGLTSIHVFTGEGAPFANDAAPGIRDFLDGTSNTFLCVAAGPDAADVWTKPGGLEFDIDDPIAALGEIGEMFQAVFADGSARRIMSNIDPETLLHLIQNRDGQVIGEF